MIPKAFALAAEAFIDIEDQGGVPHILNSIEIYNAVKYKPEFVQVAGILHDIVSRTSWTYEDLAKHDISDDTLELIELVNPKGEIHQFVERASRNRFACHICLANLRYHMKLCQRVYLDTQDLNRIQQLSNTYQLFKHALVEFHYD